VTPIPDVVAPTADAAGQAVTPFTDVVGAAATPIAEGVTPVSAIVGDVSAPTADAVAATGSQLSDASAPSLDTLVPTLTPVADTAPHAAVDAVGAALATAPLAPPTDLVPGIVAPLDQVAAPLDQVDATVSSASAATTSLDGAAIAITPDVPSSIGATAPGGGAPSGITPPGFDAPALPFDPSMIAHGLASWETRIIIGGILSGILAGRAAGIGMIDFTQPMLQACNVGFRSAFTQVRLVECGRARAVQATAGARDLGRRAVGLESHRGDGGSRQRIAVRGRHAVAAPFVWSVPAAGLMLIRLMACVLASISAVVAGQAGLRKHRRDRTELRYRRRHQS
jgi:hypothetical protein